MSDALIASLSAAVESRPDDVPLRVHLAGLLLDAGRPAEAVGQAAQALQRSPGDADARRLMLRALDARPGPPRQPPADPGAAHPGADDPGADDPSADDLSAYERELADIVPPRFTAPGPATPDAAPGEPAADVERSTVRLADVGGLAEVKQRLELAFLGPMRNPSARKLFGKSLRGGLLLYGPPGCGKTFLARAVAGEMGAAFVSLGIADVLEMWVGSSERNLRRLFDTARGHAPCVLFLDEVDALGHKRSNLQSSGIRTLGNQLLAELDGVDAANDGVFVLAATNAPWDVDPALRRPGRLDRTVFVAPPDAPARAAILTYHLRDRPIANVDLAALVKVTAGFSGADLAHLCDTAAEYALADSLAGDDVRMIGQRDFERALREVKPSTGPWLATARTVATYANDSGAYDELAAYLRRRRSP